MKKLITILIFTAISIAFTACNSCTKLSKNMESDWSDLERTITVTSAFTGDTLFHYEGPCYISSDNKSLNNVTLIYYVGKVAKKADFIGSGFNFVAIEK